MTLTQTASMNSTAMTLAAAKITRMTVVVAPLPTVHKSYYMLNKLLITNLTTALIIDNLQSCNEVKETRL